MTQATDNFVYFAHGGKAFQAEARFSILTLIALMKANPQAFITLYTDQPSRAVRHGRLKVVAIERPKIQQWMGRHSYVHRPKLEILRRAQRELGLPFIYVDTDTQWLRYPSDVFTRLRAPAEPKTRRSFYMWKRYEPILGRPWDEYDRLLRRSMDGLHTFGLDPASGNMMWNSGAIGVPANAGDIFDRALNVTDLLCEGLERHKHIRCVEQIAISLLAQNRFELHPLHDCLDHYYRHKHVSALIIRNLLGRMSTTMDVDAQARFCAANIFTDQHIATSRFVTSRRGRLAVRFERSWRNKSSDARNLWKRLQRAAGAL